MGDALKKADRDILYSLCQYGVANVWEWGAADASVGANSWRTTGDIRDNWKSMYGIWQKQKGHEKFAGPGHWNDPDMLVVGKVGWGPKLRDSQLTQNEQMTHISAWSIMAAPLLIGCDLTQLNDFTKAVLTNDEVLAVNQDPLGKRGRMVKSDGDTQVWKRELWDGTVAVGLPNVGIRRRWLWRTGKILGSAAHSQLRDLWMMKDMDAGKLGVSALVHAAWGGIAEGGGRAVSEG